MGYPIYKLLRSVNRQYPNNGFIDYVDVTESIYDSEDPDKHRLIDEDLRDLLNETLQEIYIDIAVDEVYSFPTVAGQNQYELPEDCDLRDIQEVTRTYAFRPLRPHGPMPPPGGYATISFYAGEGGTGTMDPIEVEFGETFIMPVCLFTPPEGMVFDYWINGAGFEVEPGSPIEATHDDTYTAIWREDVEPPVVIVRNATNDEYHITVRYKVIGENQYTDVSLAYDQTVSLSTGVNNKLGDVYEYVECYFEGVKFVTFNMNEIFVRDTLRDVVHPTVTPDPEHPGSNNDGGYGDNPLDNLDVNPIDNGDGGEGDNPLISDREVTIYIRTSGGTGILHYKLIGGEEQTMTLVNGGATYSFTLTGSQQINNVYSELFVRDSTDTTLCADLLDVPISDDTELGVAVPTLGPDPEHSGDNGNGGYGDNPLGEDTDPIDNGDGGYGDNPLGGDDNQGGSSGGATPGVTPDDEEPNSGGSSGGSSGGASPSVTPDDEQGSGSSGGGSSGGSGSGGNNDGGYGGNPLG